MMREWFLKGSSFSSILSLELEISWADNFWCVELHPGALRALLEHGAQHELEFSWTKQRISNNNTRLRGDNTADSKPTLKYSRPKILLMDTPMLGAPQLVETAQTAR